MSPKLLLSLSSFAFASSITPGPNNLMLLASGTNFGFRRSLPHALGVSFGFGFMVVVVGLGVTELFQRFPSAYEALKAVSAVYILWLACKMASASAPEALEGGARPMTFLQAASFQWVNPKAWSMALTTVTLYSPGLDARSLFSVALVFVLVNFPSVSSWVYLGQNMRRWLASPMRQACFNWGMAILLAGSLVMMP